MTRSHGGRIELAVTDIVMPRMNGQELVQRLRALRPGLKVIYVSGYTGMTVLESLPDPNAAFLPKPFAPDVLTRLVREMLDREPC